MSGEKRLIDLTGQTFGRWFVESRAQNKYRHTAWLCICSCGQAQEVSGHSLRDGRSTMCLTCARKKQWDTKGRLFNDKEQRCATCKEWKPLDEFYLDCTKPSGRCAECKRCKSSAEILRNTGMTLSEKDALFEEQGRKCACCGALHPGGSGKWGMDHDHETGKPRGVLCHFCNVILGMVDDSIEHLQFLIGYLKKYGGVPSRI